MNKFSCLKPSSSNICRMSGVSLIEIMISLTIGLIIVAGIGYAYLGSKQSFRTQDALSRMQEGARIAFEFMAKDIRMAGFRGCPPSDADTNLLAAPTIWYKNLIDQSFIGLIGRPLIGYEKTGGAWSAFPAGVTGVVGSVISGDALTVLHADTGQEFVVSSHAPSSNPPQFTLTADHDIKQGTILIAAKPDCSRIAIFQNTKTCTISSGSCGHAIIEHNATSPCDSGNFRKGLGKQLFCDDAHNGPVDTSTHLCADGTTSEYFGACPGLEASPVNGETIADTFGANSRLFRLSAATYYIGQNGSGEPSLYREKLDASGGDPSTTAEELVEGVQDMQLLYGEDTLDVIDKVDVYRTANNVADWNRVIAIRVSLLMVSRQDEQGITTEPQQYSLDMNGDGDVADTGETVTPNDRLLRKVFTTTIAIKNRP
ncbi:PilW family protein [Methylomonas sp. MgM2]